MASEPPATWLDVLAELETETALLAEGLRRGELLSPIRPWHPPALPPIPPELVLRAQQLLAEQHRLRQQLAAELRNAPPRCRPRTPVPSTPVPLLLDRRA
ncbi:MAG TPA: hypothetical protein VMB79_12115 [Jatrophihabitans sp.]|nr:hypothetical protein [Jatrophihabitans sp.]